MLGFFGKMPTHGDFLSKGFSPGLIEGLDKLLQASLATAADESSDARAMLQLAPSLMVNIRPGALSPSGFSGLVLPSCDRVGRIFPLCVGMEVEAGGPRLPLVWPSQALATALFTAVSGSLESDAGPDGLYRALNAMPDWNSLVENAAPFSSCSEDTVPNFADHASNYWYEGPEQRMSVVCRAHCNRLSWLGELLGTVLHANCEAGSFFATRSLLSWSHMAASVDGRWEHWGWLTHFISQPADPAEGLASLVDSDATLPRVPAV